MLMCDYCQEALKSRGEILFVGWQEMTYEESIESNITCEWCGEHGDLWEIRWIG